MTTEGTLTIDHEVLYELVQAMRAEYIEQFDIQGNEIGHLMSQLYFVVVEPFETVYPDETPTPEGWGY